MRRYLLLLPVLLVAMSYGASAHAQAVLIFDSGDTIFKKLNAMNSDIVAQLYALHAGNVHSTFSPVYEQIQCAPYETAGTHFGIRCTGVPKKVQSAQELSVEACRELLDLIKKAQSSELVKKLREDHSRSQCKMPK